MLATASVAEPNSPLQGQSEYDVKAAFLFNFAKYIDWPAGALSGGSIVIGIVGRDPFGSAIDEIVRGKTIGRYGIVVRRLKWSDDLSGCHMLFVPATETDVSGLSRLAGKPVVVVGESAGFTKRGGMINFVIESGRVRFEINVQRAKDSGLVISSKLLSLAKNTR